METQVENTESVDAAGIYGRIGTLKNEVDFFRKHVLSKLSQAAQKTLGEPFRCLYSHERINVFLAGGFSAGKTTFVKRLIGEIAGSISGRPTTACLVVHTNTSASISEIFFNQETHSDKDRPKDRQEFQNFLKKYNIDDCFRIGKDGKFIPKDKSKSDEWGTSKMSDFLKDVEDNEYSWAFEKIVWNHDKKKNVFLNFANLYDMPGLGGEEAHGEVIKNVFKNQKPDIVLYLIDPDRGIPDAEETMALPRLLDALIHESKEPPLFCWVYQNGMNIQESGENFLKEKKKNLNTFIYKLVNSDPSLTEQYRRLLDETQAEYLSESFVLDARGPEKDTQIAQNALLLVLWEYLREKANKYYEKATDILKESNPMRDVTVMDVKEDYADGKNSFFKNKIFKKITDDPENQKMDKVKKIFWEAIAMEEGEKEKSIIGKVTNSIAQHIKKSNKEKGKDAEVDDDSIGGSNYNPSDASKEDANSDEEKSSIPSDLPFDLLATLKHMKDEINKSANDLFNVLKSKDDEDYVDLNKIDYDRSFWKKYMEKESWQRILFTVQAYHWLKASYNKTVVPPYICNIGYDILDNIKKSIEKLDEIESPPSIFMGLEE